MPAGADDLAIVTAFYNSSGWRTKPLNYERFADGLRRARLDWITVECAFGSAEFTLPPSQGVIQIRGRDVLWQKERLINLAFSRLPARFTKAAWLDCDLLFENPDWAAQASRLLDTHDFVQLFDKVVRLPRGHTSFAGDGDAQPGFVAARSGGPVASRRDRHGHTGYAWAARRDALGDRGLYDACIAGGADHVMAHAICGETESPCIDRVLGRSDVHRRHFLEWCRRAPRADAPRVGFVPGTLFHLWHGDLENRAYGTRNRELADLEFDPRRDIRVGPSGCWEWGSGKPALHRWAAEYFARRKEDG